MGVAVGPTDVVDVEVLVDFEVDFVVVVLVVVVVVLVVEVDFEAVLLVVELPGRH